MSAFTRLFIGLAVLALVGAVVALISPRLFFQLLSLAGIALLVLSALVMVVTFRKAKSVSPWSLSISIAVSLILALFYTMLSKGNASPGILILSLFCGALVGTGWGLTNSLFVDSGAIKSRGNAWYLLVWALLFATTQLLTLITGRPPTVGLILLFSGTGLVLGQSGLTLTRYFRLKSQIRT